MKLRRFRSAVVHRNLDQHIFRIGLGVFHKHVEISIVIEDAGVEQFVLHLFPRTPPVRLNKVPIGILPLGILVQVLHVGVGGGAVDVEVIFLYVFAMVSFAIGQSEQALFQDGVAAIPQRQREAKLLLVVGESG